MSCIINNTSGDYTESGQGGGLYISNSNATWEGGASFTSNTASDTGDALHIVYDSYASWEGDAWFTNNMAVWSVGGVYVEMSRLSWRGVLYAL